MKNKILVLLFMILILVSCQKKESSKNEIANVAIDFEVKANEVIIDDDTVTFTDFFGKTQTLKKGNFKRVISLYHSHTALWYEVGGVLIGRVDTRGSEKQLPIAALAPEVKIVATGITGTTISVEEILSNSPDLILLGQAMGQPGLAPSFQAAGIPTIVVDYSDLKDYLKWSKVFSNLNNKPENYETIAKKSLENVLAIINSVPKEGERPKVVSLFGAFGKVSANLSKTSIGNMLSQLGAINVVDKMAGKLAEARIEMNLESLLVADPDIIIFQTLQEMNGKEAIEKAYQTNPLWKELRAVKEGKIYFLDPALFHYRPHRNYDKSYQVLYDILYPAEG